MQPDFWDRIDALLQTTQVAIDRPKGTAHPRFSDLIYPLDYGYLQGTTGGDGNELDVWRGSLEPAHCDALVCTVDLMKRDAELKLLLGCTEAEKQTVLDFYGTNPCMSALRVNRQA